MTVLTYAYSRDSEQNEVLEWGIVRINHVFLPVSKYLTSGYQQSVLYHDKFQKISVSAKRQSPELGLKLPIPDQLPCPGRDGSHPTNADVRKVGSNDRIVPLAVNGSWPERLHPVPDASIFSQ